MLPLLPENMVRLSLLVLTLIYLTLGSCNSAPAATYKVEDGKVKVFSKTFIAHYEVLPIADVGSFVILNNTYGKDRQNVFVGFNIVSGADADSFAAISNNIGKDSNHYYYYTSVLDIDLTGKSVIDFNRFFWADGDSVYFETEKISRLDSVHRAISDSIFENGVQVFYKNKMLDGLQVGRYSLYDHEYFLGLDAVYYRDLRIPTDSPKNFRLLKDYGSGKFFSDGFHVFSNWIKLKSADPNTFVCLDHGFAKDKDHVFSTHFIIKNADPESFSMIAGMAYGKDKNGIVSTNDRNNVESDAM